MFKMKKKINWKKFTEMYRDLGEFQIVETRSPESGKVVIELRKLYSLSASSAYFVYTYEGVDTTVPIEDKEFFIEFYKKKIFKLRYEQAVENRCRKSKVIYTHP